MLGLPRIRQVLDDLCQEVDGAMLAFFRIGFGFIMTWEVVRYFYYDWVTTLFVKPKFFFSWPMLTVTPWPKGGMYVHFFALGVSAVFLTLGFFYRLAAISLCGLTVYVFLLDQSYSLELNHFYLICLVTLIMVIVPGHNTAAIDNIVFPRSNSAMGRGKVPLWSIVLLRAQMLIVYGYAAVAKLSPEWWISRPAERIIAGSYAYPFLKSLLQLPHANEFMIIGGFLIDLIVPVLLLIKRTRIYGFALAASFHLLNAFLMPIGVFPALALLMTAIFLDPSLPRKFLPNKWLAEPPKNQKISRNINPSNKIFSLLTIVYIAIQLILPLRAWVYPQPSGWAEEGHFFSWRMMLLDKQGSVEFTVIDPNSGFKAIWDMNRDLTPIQISSMTSRPMLVQQYAQHISDEVASNEHIHPKVYARQMVSFAGGPPQLMIDPDRDLSHVEFSLWPYDWIIPLKKK